MSDHINDVARSHCPRDTSKKLLIDNEQLKLKQMARIQQIKAAHPWLSYDEAVKVLLYHHQNLMWIKNLERDKLERSMEEFTKLVNLRAEST